MKKAKMLATTMSWKEYKELMHKGKKIPYHLKNSSIGNNAEEEMHLLHEIFDGTKLSINIPDDAMEHTFFKVNLFAPTDQILKDIESQLNKIRKKRFNLPEEMKAIISLKTGDKRSGVKRIIKSFIDHRVLAFIDLETYSYYFGHELTMAEKLDILFRDDKRTLSLTKIVSAEKQLDLWLKTDLVRSLGSVVSGK